MADINTNSGAIANNNSKNKNELKLEERNKKYQLKLEANRLNEIKKQEAKRSRLTIKLNKVQNPKRKSRIQDKIDIIDSKLNALRNPSKATVKRPFGLVVRTWSKGLGKESTRITWHSKRGLLKDFITILLVCVFLALIFFAIDMIIISIR